MEKVCSNKVFYILLVMKIISGHQHSKRYSTLYKIMIRWIIFFPMPQCAVRVDWLICELFDVLPLFTTTTYILLNILAFIFVIQFHKMTLRAYVTTVRNYSVGGMEVEECRVQYFLGPGVHRKIKCLEFLFQSSIQI